MLKIIDNLTDNVQLMNKYIDQIERMSVNNLDYTYFRKEIGRNSLYAYDENDDCIEWKIDENELKALWDAHVMVPAVGMKATISYFSDSRGVQIVEVNKNGRELVVAHLKYTMPYGPYDGHGECTDELTNHTDVFTKRKCGWVMKGQSARGGCWLHIGYAHTFIDPSF